MSSPFPLVWAVVAVGFVLGAALVLTLVRRPWLMPWLAVPVFAASAELQLRVPGPVGAVKDVVVVALVGVTAFRVARRRGLLARCGPWRAPLAALGVLLALYVIDPVGIHGAAWALSVRLVLEASALLLVGLLAADPARSLRHLVRCVAVVTAAEALFAGVQQLVGEDNLVYRWGYQFGAQVRLTSGGGLRTSGTFGDPFQLAALGIIALGLGLFLARGRWAFVLVVSAVAILAETSVRTALLQAAVLVVVWAVARGWRLQATVVVVALAAAALLAGLTLTTAAYPGAPLRPLLLGLNGRSTAWSQAVQGVSSFVFGNGVASVGSGSTRAAQGLFTQAQAYDPTAAPVPLFSGNTAFLDSAYAQVQSDLGVVGTLALLLWLVGTLVILLRRRSGGWTPAPRAGAVGFLLASAVDWVGRTTLFSFTTGFLTLFVLGLLLAGAVPVVGDDRFGLGRPWSHAWPRRRRRAHRRTGKSAEPPRDAAPGPVERPADEPEPVPVPSSARLARLGVGAAVLSRTFGRLVGILFVVVVARTSSDDTVAVYGYLLGTATLVVTLTDLGVAAVAGREVAARRFGAAAALAAALPAQVVSVLAAWGVTLALVALSGPSVLTTAPVLLTLAFLALNGMVNLWAEVLRGEGRVLLEAGLQTLSAVLLVGGGLVVVARGGDATDLLAVVAGKEVVILGLSWFALRPRRRPDVVRTGQLVRSSVALAVAGTAAILLWRQGTVLVGARSSVTALAVWVVASRFLDAGVTLANTIGFGLLPGAASAEADRDGFRRLVRRYLVGVGVPAVVVAAVGSLAAAPITLGLFGSQWHDAVPAVRVIALAAVPILVGYVAWYFLLAAGHTRWLAGSASLGAAVAVGVSATWPGPGTSPTAAAVGTAVGATVLAVLCVGRLLTVIRTRPAPDVVDTPAPVLEPVAAG